MDRFSEVCRAFSLKFSFNKIVLMFQSYPGTAYNDSSIYADAKKLNVIYRLCFWSLYNRIVLCLFIKQWMLFLTWKTLWGHSKDWKGSPSSNACMLTCLLYSYETCLVYRKHLNQLEDFHQHCLRSVIQIHWIIYTQKYWWKPMWSVLKHVLTNILKHLL